MSIVSARGVSKAYGAQPLFEGISITVSAGERVGVLGANGAGKSTLLRVIAGLEPADAGTIDRRREASILYLAQEPELDGAKTPRAIVEAGLAEWHAARAKYEALTHAIEKAAGEEAARLAQSHAAAAEEVERLGGWERGHVVDDMLAKLGVREPDRPVESMSGGERRRVALAALLVAQPTLAILDEPTNHLDADTIEWLEEYLAESYRGAVLLVTHDRYVLDAIATRIVELENGQLTEYEGNYGDYLEQKAERLAHAQRVEANRLNFVRRESAWLMRGARARTTKQKARIQRAKAAIAIDAPKEQQRVQLEAQSAQLGKRILEMREARYAIDGRTIVPPITLHMVSGERIGVLGPNGAGKTTLLRLVAGEIAPTSGEVIRGLNTKIAYFDQARAQLEDDKTIFENVADVSQHGGTSEAGGVVRLGDRTVEMRAYLEMFLFSGSKQRQKVGSLSGGERARVALAKTLRHGANLLLLDEPTNDLDVQTLGALEDLLETWSGCALVVSHDRYFLNRVATGILAFEGGSITRYPGNYDTYRALRPASAASAPAATAANAATSASADKGARGETARAGDDADGAPRTGAGASSASSAPGVSASAAAAARPVAAKKLTYAERIELDGIFDKIGEAEAKVAEAEAELQDPTLYATRPEAVRDANARLAAAQAEVARLTARWEELEAKKTGATGG